VETRRTTGERNIRRAELIYEAHLRELDEEEQGNRNG